MATYAPLILGTPITWQQSGGTYAMNMDSLTNTSARQGVKSATLVDGTKGMPAFLQVEIQTVLQLQPTEPATLDVYLSFSSSATAGTDNPGGCTGTDAAFSNTDGGLQQLVFAGSLVCSHTISTGTQLQKLRLVAPLDAYVAPVAVNSSGQTTSATANKTIITITPLYQQSS